MSTDTYIPQQPAESELGGYDAVLLASFGGPEGQDDVIPFLRNVTRGKGIPDERLEEVATHYRANGGVSPINEQNRGLKAALEAEFAEREISLPIYWGNRNWDPYFSDAFTQMHADGHRRVLVLVTSAYAGYSSNDQYLEDFERTLQETELQGSLELVKVRQFFYDKAFTAPHEEFLAAGLRDVAEQHSSAAEGSASQGSAHRTEKTKVLFVTHSIPTATAERQGPERIRQAYGTDVYTAQHQALADYLMRAVPEAEGVDYQVVFQSRSGDPATPWLEPDINDQIEADAQAGYNGVVVIPFGFISDHMEVIWDLDTEAKETAEEQNMAFHRAPTTGIHSAFVTGLVDVMGEYLTDAEGKPLASGEQKVPGDWSDLTGDGGWGSPL